MNSRERMMIALENRPPDRIHRTSCRFANPRMRVAEDQAPNGAQREQCCYVL